MTKMPIRLVILQRPDHALASLWERLQRWGCELQPCASAEAAFASLIGRPADLVVADAAADGALALLRRLRSEPRFAPLPVIAAIDSASAAQGRQAIEQGADDLWAEPLTELELDARLRAWARSARMELELRRRTALLASFGVTPATPAFGLASQVRTGVLLVGPPSGEQVQVMTALAGGTTASYAETVPAALECLRHGGIEVVLITARHDDPTVQELCRAIRCEPALFDLPVLLVTPAAVLEPSLAFRWGVSDILTTPFEPALLRLRVQGCVRQQRLRRQLRARGEPAACPPTSDRLTGLHAHGFLHAYIAAAGDQAWPLAVACFDVRGMQAVNQAYGYAAGDRLLAQIGGLLAQNCRAEDLPARFGGDRFCVVLHGTGLADGRVASQRLATLLGQTLFEPGPQARLQVELKIGTAELRPAEPPGQFLGRAFAELQPFELRRAS